MLMPLSGYVRTCRRPLLDARPWPRGSGACSVVGSDTLVWEKHLAGRSHWHKGHRAAWDEEILAAKRACGGVWTRASSWTSQSRGRPSWLAGSVGVASKAANS
jgi:hypothetical protein